VNGGERFRYEKPYPPRLSRCNIHAPLEYA
jgi:hypothetical protein